MRRPLVGALLALVLAPAAWAQEPEPGLTIDPDSPSGREYDIPLESARREAQPGRDRGTPVPQGERSAPLFGEGITTKVPDDGRHGSVDGAASGSGSGPGGGRSDGVSGGGGQAATRSGAQPPPAVVRAAASNPAAPAGGFGTTALVILGGVFVLGVGVGAGLLAKRASSAR